MVDNRAIHEAGLTEQFERTLVAGATLRRAADRRRQLSSLLRRGVVATVVLSALVAGVILGVKSRGHHLTTSITSPTSERPHPSTTVPATTATIPPAKIVGTGEGGLPFYSVPNLVGKTENEYLFANPMPGVNVYWTDEADGGLPEGTILAQSVQPGKFLEGGGSTEIGFTIAGNGHEVLMPNLYGVSESEAAGRLRGLGFRRIIIPQIGCSFVSSMPDGVVYFQEPPAGVGTDPLRSTVTLMINQCHG